MIAVITGASQGIGEAVARRLAREPEVKLALLARSVAKLEAVAQACEAAGAKTLVVPCDVTDEVAVNAAAQKVEKAFGITDVLVNNAGLFRPGGLLDTSVEDFREQVEVNLTSAFLVTRAFLPAMIARGSGDVFFMASVASVRGYPAGSAYCAAKHGLLGMARALREETKPKGIRIITLMPGATLTASWEGVDLPEARFIPPEDVAEVVAQTHALTGRTVVEEILLRPQLGDI